MIQQGLMQSPLLSDSVLEVLTNAKHINSNKRYNSQKGIDAVALSEERTI